MDQSLVRGAEIVYSSDRQIIMRGNTGIVETRAYLVEEKAGTWRVDFYINGRRYKTAYRRWSRETTIAFMAASMAVLDDRIDQEYADEGYVPLGESELYVTWMRSVYAAALAAAKRTTGSSYCNIRATARLVFSGKGEVNFA